MAANKKKPEHYVNNPQFSMAVHEYVEKANKAAENGEPEPVIPDYIAECFLKIAQRLASRSNFGRYSFKEEMVMDAVENQLKAIKNYNLEAATRTGKPNAFSYFTQISWFAFIRRIQSEEKYKNLKLKYIQHSTIDSFLNDTNLDDQDAITAVQAFVDELRNRIDVVKKSDEERKQTVTPSEIKKIKRTRKTSDSDVTNFFIEG